MQLIERMIILNLNLDPILFNKIPSFKLGLNHYTKITVSESPQMLKGRLQLFQELLFFDLEEKATTEFPGIHEWRMIWKQLGADPDRYPHSAEALLHRIAKQNYLAPEHSAVDLNTFFSLQYQMPIGIYDADKINGKITVSIGDENSGYEGPNGQSIMLKNIPILSDDKGPFGSPYIDSLRTTPTENTTNAVHIFFLPPSLSVDNAIQLTKAAGKMFTEISGGDVNSCVLHKAQPSIIVEE